MTVLIKRRHHLFLEKTGIKEETVSCIHILLTFTKKNTHIFSVLVFYKASFSVLTQ